MKLRRWPRIFLRFAIAIVVVVVVLYTGVSLYVSSHEKQIITTISKRLKGRVNGELKIEDISISLFRDFPRVSVVLNNVSLRDTLYHVHKRPVLQVDEVRVVLIPLSVLSGKPSIRKFHFVDGTIDIFTDSNGYSNVANLFVPTGRNKRPPKPVFAFQLTDVTLSYADERKKKLFRLNIHELYSRINNRKHDRRIVLQMKAKVEECNFNTDKGSFLKNKTLSGNLHLNYIFKEQTLHLLRNTLKIDKVPMQLQGTFMVKESPIQYSIDLVGNHVMFHEVASMLSPAIASKLAFFKAYKPVDIHALIEGKMKYKDTPDVFVSWKVKNNELMTPVGKMEQVDFEGYYLNNKVKYAGHTDANSEIVLRNVKAKWFLIPLSCDSIKIADLINPYIESNVNASFPARLLNPVIGGESFLLGDGRIMLDVDYRGRLFNKDSVKPSFNGYLSLEKVSLKYLPRNLFFKECNALLQFQGTDIVMKNVFARTNKSVIAMDGVAKDFFSQFNQSPDSINIQWNVKSEYIDFSDFNSFLQPRKRKTGPVKNSSKMARNLDKVLDASTVELGVRVNKLQYRKFTATDISADIKMGTRETDLKQIVLSQSGGKIYVSGNLKQYDSVTNKFGVAAKVENVDVQKLFYSFEDFGQSALSYNNLRGVFSANVNAEGLLRAKGKIVPNSITGTMDFQLINGALVRFKPLEKVGKIIFKKRNLSNVTFKNIENTFVIDKNKVIIPPMLIESSALNINVSGIFGFDNGTDIALEIPLRNPNKDEVKIATGRQLKNRRGLVLYLRAIEDSTGNVKITWDKSKQRR